MTTAFAGGLFQDGVAQNFGGIPLIHTATAAPAIAAELSFYPDRLERLRQHYWLDPSSFAPVAPLAVAPTIPGYGPAGAATFAMWIEAGAKITFGYQTDIIKAWSGLEQRIAVLEMPRQTYDFTSLLADAQARTVLGELVGNAAQAQPFLVGLAFEALTIRANGTTTTIPVRTTTLSDWIQPGQRLVVVADDGVTNIGAVVQSSTSNTIIVDVDVSALATVGATVMPAMAIYLDGTQNFARYTVNVERWDMKARAALFGFAGTTAMGIGATVQTHDSMPIWDRGIDIKNTVAKPLFSGADLVDLGGTIADVSSYAVADWGRQISLSSTKIADWQWLKAFIASTLGQQVTFLLPTWQPDMVAVGDASSGTLTIVGPTAGGVDYANDWFPSLAHRRVMLLMADGTINYHTVETATDFGTTQQLALDSTQAGAIAMVSFLETCRFASDNFAVAWNGAVFSVDLDARVVQQ